MPVKRRKAKVRIQGFPDWQIRFMETGTVPADSPDINEYEVIEWKYHRATPKHDPVQDAWLKVGEKITAAWINRHPGTRPYCWFEFTGPREPIGTRIGWHNDGKLSAPRLRLGGVGTPANEVLAFNHSYRFEIPTEWVTQRQADTYNGRTRDIHGNRIEKWKGGFYEEGDFKGVAIDPSDPPVFESQAAYLDRHKLLTDDERECLPADAFEPVAYVSD